CSRPVRCRCACSASSCSATPCATPSTQSCGDPMTTLDQPDPAIRFDPGEAPLLEVDDLHVEFRTRDGVLKAVNGESFTLGESETLAILGESGAGKSVTAQAIMGILDTPPGYVTGGEVRFRGDNLLTSQNRRQFRGPNISMIFQDALSALNPVFTVGWQI